MFTSSFSNNVSPTRFYVDNMMGYDLVDDNLNPYSSYYHLPSPLIYDEINIFGDSFSHHELAIIQQSLRPNSSIVTDDSSNIEVTTRTDSSNGIVEDGNQKIEVMARTSVSNGIKRRRTSKKDRHSKIRTAHGLRDRRMRLSREVASPFFKLQDVLGYDKGSSTIEWLMVQSKPAIEELYMSKNIVSPNGVMPKCSMTNSNSQYEDEEKEITNSKGRRASTTAKEKRPKEKRKETTKESRNEARVRAKNRTLKKIQTRQVLKQSTHGHDEIFIAHSNFDPFNYMMEECNNSSSHSNKDNNSVDTIDHGSLTTEDWSPLTTFKYHQARSYKISMQ